MLVPSILVSVILALSSAQSYPWLTGPASSRALAAICSDTASIYHSNARISACTRLIRGQFGTPRQRAQIYRTRGIALDILGRDTDALKDFDQVLNLDPDLTDVRVRRAHLRFKAGDTTGAFADLDEAVRSRPNDPTLLETRAFSYFATGDIQRAGADFNAALALRGPDDPDLFAVYHNRGLIEFDKGDYTSAINHFTLALSFGPADTPLSLEYRGQAYLAVGEPARALADFTMLAEDPPHVWYAQPLRARALDALGRHLEARMTELRVWVRETAGALSHTRDRREGFAIDVTLALNSHVPLLTPYWDELNLRCNLVSWTIWQQRPTVCPDNLPAPRLL